MTTTTLITAKYLKPAQYDAKLFKVCEHDTSHEKLNKFVKVWEGTHLIYLKEKYLAKTNIELVPLEFYKLKLTFDEFTNSNGEFIQYISKIRLKHLPAYVDPTETTTNELSDDEDF
tara:strand:- start:4012 stop:4359 length:348 start_codon:yes stop_codon:yes gene_type:complete